MKSVEDQFNDVFKPVSLDSEYAAGIRDCLAGKQPQSDNEEYMRGYRDQYFLEQVADHATRETV